MLQRTKYNRFRNDSVTSVDDLIHNLSMNSKVSAVATTSAAPSYLVTPEVLRKDQEDGPTTLCTLIHKVSHLKFSNTGSLLGIKNLSSAVKELAVSKLQGGSSASSSAAEASDSTRNLVSANSCSLQDTSKMSMGKKTRSEEMRPEDEDCNQKSSIVNKPSQGWLHLSEKILGPGVTYIVKYLGCIEVLRSMRSLDFDTRTQITREAISRVCEAVPAAKGAFKKRKPPSKVLSNILGKSNLQFAGMSIMLNISTASLNLMTPDMKQIIANHHIQSISFASGGDPDTTDYVAYVAKDPVNRRACHILECCDGLAQDIISTIGQAFELRFKQYLQCPSKITTFHDRMQSFDEPLMEEESVAAEHPYYNKIPNKLPPPGGFIDSRLKGRILTAADPTQFAAGVRREKIYYQNHHLGDKFNEDWHQKSVKQEPFEDALKNQMSEPVPSKLTSVECTSPLLCRATDWTKTEELSIEPWYQGEMSRKEAEQLLRKCGDFLVRRSTTNPGSYVLTGMQNGQAKHLLLVDPEGTVRTKDRVFDSISHLINHHLENNLPIVSSGSELCLQQPAERKH
ncbi:SHC-transforming protein 3 isoform X2 [Excalfactoria chinensis]|uniref:SHC-transforming protein 3 isoform X2 n=1 Tax=Excalfactoria chinensis TaxID=46218 RepID=UPI003B3B125F